MGADTHPRAVTSPSSSSADRPRLPSLEIVDEADANVVIVHHAPGSINRADGDEDKTKMALAERTSTTTADDSKRRQRRLRKWYAHMVLINVAEFAAEAARGMVLPTMFSYAALLDGDLVFVGLLTALFSAGRFISALAFGWLSDRISFKVVYHVAAVLSIIGNLMYILPYASASRSKLLLGASRFMVGVGAGNRSVCRANIAALTRVDQRLQWFNLFATVVFLAYALTPGLGALFGNVNVAIVDGYFHLNQFTAPGYLLIGFNLLTIVVTLVVYDDSITRADAPGAEESLAKKTSAMDVEAAAGQDSSATVPSTSTTATTTATTPDMTERMVTIGMIVFIFQNFIARGILSIFETVNMPLYLKTIDDANAEALAESTEFATKASEFYTVVGLLGLLSYAAVQVLGKKISDLTFLLFGFFTLIVGNAILMVLSLLETAEGDDKINFEMFVLAEIFIWSIGCPLASAVVASSFSKVLGTRPQGLLMGIFGSCGSIARMIMPFLPGVLPSLEVLFLVNMLLCSTCIVALLIYLRLLSASAAAKTLYQAVDPVSTSPSPTKTA